MSAPYDDSATAAAEPTAAGSNLSDTAFRRAEKRYQLHYEQQLRNRKGRLRGGKLVLQPTDLSDVIDVRNATSTDDISMCSLQQPANFTACACHPSPPCSGASTTFNCSGCGVTCSSSVTALVFKRHPGLVVFPAAVPAQLQLQLMQAALQEWPDPPARTNHTRVHGMTLCQLFHAAQQDWSLAEQPQQQLQQHNGGASSTAHQQQQPSQQQCPTCQQDMVCQAQQQLQPQQQQQQQQKQQKQQHCHLQKPVQPQAALKVATTISSEGSSSRSSGPWSASGTGPSASVLLRKLRWVCLGPPYNWTNRVYEPHLPHRPLPPLLVRLAQQYVDLAQRAQAQAAAGVAGDDAAAATAASVSLQPGANGSCIVAAPSDAAGRSVAGAQPLNCPHGSTAGSEQQQGSSMYSSKYVPNAALVNYYHSGDTLNGHKDDVERDLSQPIVTLSLGCDAVFLVGGLTRDVEPTALLLRSGDIVVMGQEARACYHGVPRVLTDNPLADDLLQEAEQAGAVYQPYLQHMQGCRVNISIRST